MRRPRETQVVIDPMDEMRWRIVIPGKPTGSRMFAAIFILCWLAGWAIGEVFAIRALFGREKNPEIQWSFALWAFGWTLGGVAGMGFLRRVLDLSFGIESLLIDPERVKLVRGLWGSVSIRSFRTERVEGFEPGGFWGMKMTVEGRAVGFGGSLTPEERAWLLEELKGILDKLRGPSRDL